MIRVLWFFILIGLAAWGLARLAEAPGAVTIAWGADQFELSLMAALAGVLLMAAAIAILWGLFRFVFRLPSIMALAAKARRRDKGFAALTRGMLAVGAGDARAAGKHAADAHKLLGHEPLTKLLRAQAAQLSGDRAGAVKAFQEMLDHDAAHTLGLRGLHLEAKRGGDAQAALEFAARAHARGALPWAGQAVLDARAAQGDWAGALKVVESDASARLLDKPAANRLRAVLKTAQAGAMGPGEAKAALALAQDAVRLAPGLVPAAALAAKLSAQAGDYKRASKVIEAAYAQAPHPDLANAYLRLRPGDAAIERLARAKALARLAPGNLESALALGRAALEARDFAAAKGALAPLFEASAPTRPTVRACLLMADIAEAQGAPGATREWLARAARAARDPAWVADGVSSDSWSPVSPTGKIDAYAWRVPDERLSAPEPFIEAPAIEAEIEAQAVEAKAIEPPKPPQAPPQLALVEPPPVAEAAPRGLSVLDLAAPDDPGPHAAGSPKRGFKMFSGGG